MCFSHLGRIAPIIAAILLLLVPLPAQANAFSVQAPEKTMPGCTVFYGYDGQTALGGNNEDFDNPFTFVWFIPASPGRFGRVYFGYDDFIPQGGLNDQGVFFDGLALPYKAMPETSQRPHFTGGDLALFDEILSRSANVQDVIEISSSWNRLAGEYSQTLYGDRFGDSVIIDGDTILPKQGSFQLATNFRLVDNPNPPYPEERYGTLYDMFSKADHYTVELFRKALDAAHAEGDVPTLYSQVYELNTGIIHLYQFPDLQHEVVLNLADELAKGPHVAAISSLFPKNDDLVQWASQRETQWKASFEGSINTSIKPESQRWMSGEYNPQEEADAGPVKIYMENDQLYLLNPNQAPIELFPTAPDAVFHHYFNGMDLNLTFQRNLWGQATGAQGTYSFKPYNIEIAYQIARPGVVSYSISLLITIAGVGAVLILLILSAFVLRRNRRRNITST
jgi:hypothetical protein